MGLFFLRDIKMIESSCHCGNVRLEIDAETPSELTSCNCSICKRLGGLMSYFSPKKVKVLAEAGATDRYVWGDKMLAFVRCANCGCFSHWESIDPESTLDRMGVTGQTLIFEDANCDFK